MQKPARAVRFCLITLVYCWLILLTIVASASAANDAVTTYHFDNGRTGWYSHQTAITPANVGNLQLLATAALYLCQV
jgi:hypothetical protein